MLSFCFRNELLWPEIESEKETANFMTQCHGFCEVYKSDLDNLPDTRRVRRSSKFHRRNESEAEAKEMEVILGNVSIH